MAILDSQLTATLFVEVAACSINGRLFGVVETRCAVGIVPFIGPLPIRALGYHPVLRFAHVRGGSSVVK